MSLVTGFGRGSGGGVRTVWGTGDIGGGSGAGSGGGSQDFWAQELGHNFRLLLLLV